MKHQKKGKLHTKTIFTIGKTDCKNGEENTNLFERQTVLVMYRNKLGLEVDYFVQPLLPLSACLVQVANPTLSKLTHVLHKTPFLFCQQHRGQRINIVKGGRVFETVLEQLV